MNKCVCCGTDTEFIVCISCVAECKGCDNYNCYRSGKVNMNIRL
jgi:hypothetical protein